ncbi:hypothetical protein Q0590_01045 [Rhodocytophaga aerolata]|uniref:Uncharacterized protein n=1 Tax=Rhodocytophaga aerolata TaxID=455078 RepID=A0ABT8QY94_9BACT|nr:hypothetical protein [Rhodocytophaga aerolata]MDO1444811.1 hypothetical protein [Rhodocytophaga aerolata]
MKNVLSTFIITSACVIGSFLGIIVYELVSDFLYSGTWTWSVLTSTFFQAKVVSILTATLLGAIGQEVIIPIQHKFTFWRYIRRRSMLNFSLIAGIALSLSGTLAIILSIFITEDISLADFFVNNYIVRPLSILPAAFVFGACYGLGRWKSFQQTFKGYSY